MIKNYFKIAWRNLIHHRLNSSIYIGGLAIALCCVLFIGIYIEEERSFDRFFPDAHRIYRVNIDGKMGPEEFIAGNTPPPVGQALQDNFPEVADYTRLYLSAPENVSYTDGDIKKLFTETRLFSVDSNFLDFFAYPLVEGATYQTNKKSLCFGVDGLFNATINVLSTSTARYRNQKFAYRYPISFAENRV